MSGEKLSTHERAKVAARAKWGPRRVARLDQLSPELRSYITALLEAEEAAKRLRAEKDSAA